MGQGQPQTNHNIRRSLCAAKLEQICPNVSANSSSQITSPSSQCRHVDAETMNCASCNKAGDSHAKTMLVTCSINAPVHWATIHFSMSSLQRNALLVELCHS